MNSEPQLTLTNIRKSPALGRVSKASDFLTEEEREELRRSNLRGKVSKRKFEAPYAHVAEIIARFGYDTYLAWNSFEISEEKMNQMIMAERAREKSQLLALETIVIQMVGSCIKREKGQSAPKGPKQAQKVIKEEIKTARGE